MVDSTEYWQVPVAMVTSHIQPYSYYFCGQGVLLESQQGEYEIRCCKYIQDINKSNQSTLLSKSPESSAQLNLGSAAQDTEPSWMCRL